jgi:hypothetical protein
MNRPSRRLILMIVGLLVTLCIVGAQTASAASANLPLDYAGTNPSLVLDSAGNPVIAYYDVATSDLMLARCDDPTCVNGVSIQTVDSGDSVGQWPSLELDSNGYPVITYSAQAPSGTLRLARCNDLYCAGGDEFIRNMGYESTYTSLELDSSGNPVVAYVAGYQQYVVVTHCNDPYCSTASEKEIFQTYLAWGPDMALDAQGFPVVSFVETSTYPNPRRVKLIHCNDTKCSGKSIETVDTVNDVDYASLALDGNGNPVLSYGDDPGLMLAHCNDTRCAGANESIQNVAAVNDVFDPSLALDVNGNPVISYEGNPGLKLVLCNDPNCVGADEAIQTLESSGKARQTSLALSSSGIPVVSFVRDNNALGYLYLAVCDNASCDPSLNVVGTGTGSGTMTASGITCSYDAGVTSGDCIETASGSNRVTVVAAPTGSSLFTSWSGCDSISTTNPSIPGDTCTVTVTSLRTITAHFRQAPHEMHVQHIEPGATLFVGGWWADATIYIAGDDGYPVSNVTVTGKWRYGSAGQKIVTCVTDYEGRCNVSLRASSWPKVTFTVTNVTGGSLPYNPTDNVMTSVDVCKVEGGYCE